MSKRGTTGNVEYVFSILSRIFFFYVFGLANFISWQYLSLFYSYFILPVNNRFIKCFQIRILRFIWILSLCRLGIMEVGSKDAFIRIVRRGFCAGAITSREEPVIHCIHKWRGKCLNQMFCCFVEHTSGNQHWTAKHTKQWKQCIIVYIYVSVIYLSISNNDNDTL